MNIKKTFDLKLSEPSIDAIFNDEKDILYYKTVTIVPLEGEPYQEEHWFINDVDTKIATTGTSTEISPNKIEPRTKLEPLFINNLDENTFNEQFSILNQKVNNVRRELTYWDVYHIKDRVNVSTELETKFSQLNNGESLVINTENSFNDINNVTYSRGDVVVKTLQGEAVLIKALSGGIYYPSAIIAPTGNDKAYTIKYAFSSSVPASGSVENVSVENASVENVSSNQTRVLAPAEEINFTGFELPANMRQPYNLTVINPTPPNVFKKVLYNDGQETKLIQPIIKFFDENNEELYIEYTLTDGSDNNYSLSGYPSIVKTIIIK